MVFWHQLASWNLILPLPPGVSIRLHRFKGAVPNKTAPTSVPRPPALLFLLKKNFLMYLFWETDRVRVERDRERGRHRIRSRLQILSCQHRAWHGAWTHKPWDHDLRWSRTLNWLSQPGAPGHQHFWSINYKSGGFSEHLTFDNLLEWVTELRKVLYLWF